MLFCSKLKETSVRGDFHRLELIFDCLKYISLVYSLHLNSLLLFLTVCVCV